MISIIIPVYNVEEYLEDCLKSVITQTVLDKEIILIDDGSTDQSSNICKTYYLSYPEIKYIYQENQGAAAARNTGLRYARGEYITFMDADDIYLSENALQIALSELIQNDVDQVIFGKETFYFPSKHYSSSNKIEIIDSKEALRRLLLNQISVSVCNKLFRKSIINKLTFPAGRSAEDQLFSFEAIIKGNKILLLDKVLYGYRQRKGSTTHTLSYRSLDVLSIKKIIYDNITHRYPEFKKYQVVYFGISVTGLKERNNAIDGQNQQISSIITKEFNKYFFKILSNLHVPIKQKIHTFLVAIRVSHLIKKFQNKH